MAEYVMKDLVHKAGLDGEFEISSAATSSEEIGNGVYPPVRKLLEKAGIDCSAHHARRMTQSDYRHYDRIIAMDSWNISNIDRIIGHDTEHKVSRLLDYLPGGGDIADPWYTRDFDLTWLQVNEGCKALLDNIAENTVSCNEES